VTYTNFKPQLWSHVLLEAEKKMLVFGGPGVVNNDYEGIISGQGTTVHITQLGDPTVSSYNTGGSIAYQALSDAGMELLIDQEKYLAVEVDDVDKLQAAGDFQSYVEDRMAYKLADTVDQFLAGLYTNVAQANIISTNSTTAGDEIVVSTYATSTPADFYMKVVLPLKVKLDEAYVPANGRYLIIPPWAEALLLQTQAFIAITDMSGDPSKAFTNGYIGRVAGFDVYKSNNSVNFDPTANSNQGGWIIQAGHPLAITYAEQIMKFEAIRLQTSFGDGLRVLHVYGAKLVRPDHIAVAGVQRPTGL